MITKFSNKVGFYLMRTVKSQKMRDYFANKRIKQIKKSTIPEGVGKLVEMDGNELNEKGYIDLGKYLSEKEVNHILEKIKAFQCYDPFRKELGLFNIENTPDQVHVANYRRKDLATLPELVEIANNSEILKVVQDFLGATPTISNVNMWWSIPGKEQAEQAQLFHRDVDDFKFCKLFIYLTDVDMNTGPHVYVEGSSSSEKLRKIRRYTDEEISDVFGKDAIKYFTAPKGSAFLVDTYGFHKGFLPKDKKRLLFQVQYSLNPIGIESYEPVDIGAHEYHPYVNRLILK